MCVCRCDVVATLSDVMWGVGYPCDGTYPRVRYSLQYEAWLRQKHSVDLIRVSVNLSKVTAIRSPRI